MPSRDEVLGEIACYNLISFYQAYVKGGFLKISILVLCLQLLEKV